MKRTIKIILGILLLLIVYVLYTFQSTGFFRTIENKFEGKILKSIPIPGAEDLQISYTDHFMLISSDSRADWRGDTDRTGGLYFMDLKDPTFTPKYISGDFTKPFFPHGISMIQLDSAVYKIYAINHAEGKHFIEVFNLFGDSLVHEKTLEHELIKSPNDIVAINPNEFYFTNDHGNTEGIGKLAEEYLGLKSSNVIYFDGSKYREVAGSIVYANGINKDPARALLYVASPRGFLVKVYKMEDNHDLTFVEDIDCGTGVDNIEFDTDGKLWIGCHPSLLTFTSYSKGKLDKTPSEIITIDYRGKGDYDVETVFMDDGTHISGSTVAPTYGNLIFVGNVMDEEFLVLERN